MDNKAPHGAKLLVTKPGQQPQEVMCFVGMPIETNDLIAVNMTEDEFVTANRIGFVLVHVDQKTVILKLLSGNPSEKTVGVEEQSLQIGSEDVAMKLLSTRGDSEIWETV